MKEYEVIEAMLAMVKDDSNGVMMSRPLIDPWTKRRYNLCYRARLKGYRIDTQERTIYRGHAIDQSMEKKLNEYGFHVQQLIFPEQ